jgi:hypothetical protein
MSLTLNQTDTGIHDRELDVRTLSLHPNEWFPPDRKDDATHSTALELDSAKLQIETTRILPSAFGTPIRKSSLGVKLSGHRFKVLQQWECIVTAVQDDCVCCEMHDLSVESNPIEYAEVLVEEFSEYDRPILTEGSVFYWSVGYIQKANGQIRKSSELRVRRMPSLTSSQKVEIARKVGQLRDLISNE